MTGCGRAARKVLGRPEWATEPIVSPRAAQRVAHKAELLPLIAEALKAKPARCEWLAALEKPPACPAPP
jgi:crotonobetainyl-CoA:carnitine CoA-transferase CaiB-like acyl-CoA transferase